MAKRKCRVRQVLGYVGPGRVVGVDRTERRVQRKTGGRSVVACPGTADAAGGDHFEAGGGTPKGLDFGRVNISVSRVCE
jgi:hypothetical protein